MDPNQETFPSSGLGGPGNICPAVFQNCHGIVTTTYLPTFPLEWEYLLWLSCLINIFWVCRGWKTCFFAVQVSILTGAAPEDTYPGSLIWTWHRWLDLRLWAWRHSWMRHVGFLGWGWAYFACERKINNCGQMEDDGSLKKKVGIIFYWLSHQKVEFIVLLLNVDWPSDLLWPMECSRSDVVWLPSPGLGKFTALALVLGNAALCEKHKLACWRHVAQPRHKYGCFIPLTLVELPDNCSHSSDPSRKGDWFSQPNCWSTESWITTAK